MLHQALDVTALAARAFLASIRIVAGIADADMPTPTCKPRRGMAGSYPHDERPQNLRTGCVGGF